MLSGGVVSAPGHLQLLPQLVQDLSWSLVSLCILPYSELLCPMKPLRDGHEDNTVPSLPSSYRLGFHICPASEPPPRQDIR